MAVYNVLGLIVSVTLVIAIAAAITVHERRRVLRQLFVAGLLLRVFGSLAYFVIITEAYGSGDFSRYLEEATVVVESAQDPNRVNVSASDAYGKWWGTPSITIFTSWSMFALGTAPVPIFIVFGCVSFLAAMCFFYAFRNAFPEVDPKTYAMWLMLFPSLWFWPSPVGKDGPVLLGIGLAFLGVMGARGRRSYLLIAVGVFVTVAVRPQYALVFAAALVGGILLGRRFQGGSVAKFIISAAVVLGSVFLASAASELLGFDVTEAEETAEWIDRRGEVTAYGGSAFEAAGNPITGTLTTLLRPFPWEARGFLVLLSSVEVTALWFLLYRRRRSISIFVKRYRRTEAFLISFLFVLALSAAVGMAVGNFGTLVRQRIHIYPFLFLIAASYPYVGHVVRRGAVTSRDFLRRRTPEPA